MTKFFLLACACIVMLSSCKEKERQQEVLNLEKVNFAALEQWENDKHEAALDAFIKSCERIGTLPDDRALGDFAGTVAHWKPVCDKATKTSDAKGFFEQEFQPFLVKSDDKKEGLFTGYYEVSLEGSRTKSDRYATPLHARPENLVKLDVSDFVSFDRKTHFIGRLENGWLKPLPDRAGILNGAIKDEAKELVYVNDPVQAFFLHIQGSGRVLLEDGSEMRVGFAERNGHDYTPIGRVLIEMGELTKENVSAESIKEWLRNNPDKADAIMNSNASYIFFREIEGDGPIGGQGVPLTAGRSLAVDKGLIPYGVPIWLETTLPKVSDNQEQSSFNRLMVAQDTGGAIKGAVRGDVFFGYGREAEVLAGHMKQAGQYYVLLPKGIDG